MLGALRFRANPVAHFAINADDVEPSRAFYARVFGWKFSAWGPPGFYQIEAAGLAGARRAAGPPRAGPGPADDRVRVHLRGRLDRHDGAGSAGGTVVLDRSVIPGVGTRMFFADPDGNVFGAMQYDTAAE